MFNTLSGRGVFISKEINDISKVYSFWIIQLKLQEENIYIKLF